MNNLSHGPYQETASWDAPDPAQSHRQGKPRKIDLEQRYSAIDRVAQLARTIESEIIPRLLLAHTVAPRADESKAVDVAENSDSIEELSRIVVQEGLPQANELIEKLLAHGTSMESIFLSVLAPAARRLGTAWDNDTLSFVEVTIGLSRLQQLLRGLSPAFETLRTGATHGHRAVLMSASGEQHSFGLVMVEVFFRRAGWDVVNGAALPFDAILDILRRQWIDVIGISKSNDDLLDTLASDITTLRRASRNKYMTVMVGGAAFEGYPERITRVGADLSARDGQEAALLAIKCVKTRQAKRSSR